MTSSTDEVCVTYDWDYFLRFDSWRLKRYTFWESKPFGADNSPTRFMLRAKYDEYDRDSLYVVLASCNERKLFVTVKFVCDRVDEDDDKERTVSGGNAVVMYTVHCTLFAIRLITHSSSSISSHRNLTRQSEQNWLETGTFTGRVQNFMP